LPDVDAKIYVGYASSVMHSDTGLWIEAALLIFTFFVVAPTIAAAIGYAAWKGKPTNVARCIGRRSLPWVARRPSSWCTHNECAPMLERGSIQYKSRALD
jgi:hypothetical protein